MDNQGQVRRRKGFWSGMPTDLKGRAVAWLVYYLIAAAVFSQNAILGIALLVLPGLWYLGKNWMLGEMSLNTDLERKDTLSGYTVSYVWNSSIYVRAVMVGGSLLLVMTSLGWISTEDLRFEAAKPTVTERVAGAAGTAVEVTREKTGGWVDATKETTGGWVDTAKGWFAKEEDHSP